MENQKQHDHTDALNEIRNMMERSSRFISLSGLSGVFVGLFALAGALAAHLYLRDYKMPGGFMQNLGFKEFFFLDAGAVLLASMITSGLMTSNKARKQGLKLWDSVARRVFFNMMIPLSAGGFFCLIMLYHNHSLFISAAMLIFYGLALVNASKYTFDDIRSLGLIEILLGLGAAIFPGKGLIFWAIGFGVMHIIYGIVMYYRYEKK